MTVTALADKRTTDVIHLGLCKAFDIDYTTSLTLNWKDMDSVDILFCG